MPAVRYITSDSQMIAPGVYVKENAPAVPIRGQRNRVIAFGGQCVRGPVGRLVMCDSYQRFLDVFGGRDYNANGGTIIGHVWKALQGKRWGRIGVYRAAAAAAATASFTLESAAGGAGTVIGVLSASSPGLWGNDVQFKVTAATNGDAAYWNLRVKLYGKEYVFENICTTGMDNSTQVIGNDDGTLVRFTRSNSGRPVNNAASTDGADSDGWTNLGETVTDFTSVAGTDGAIADSDYTAADGLIDTLNSQIGIHAVAVVGRSNSTIKDAIETAAATANQRVWFICPDAASTTRGDAITERAGLVGGRMSYWFNHVYITDPVTLEEVVEEPFLYPMSIISQTDPDVHVGDTDNAQYTRSARRVYNDNLDGPKRDALTTGGVSFMLHDQDQNGNDIIIPGNAVTCDFARNNRELDGRYMKDFILDALAQRLRGDQFKGNTPLNRANRASACSTFLEGLARNDRYVLRTSAYPKGEFQYVNDETVNNADDQADGDQRELCVVRLIPKNIRILLNATIGTDATVTEQ